MASGTAGGTAGHGGARPGAGRKKKAVKHAGQIERAEKKIADKLPALADILLELAKGGAEHVVETFEFAGALVVDDVETDPESGRLLKVKRPAFPESDPADLVLTKRVVSYSAPDRAAAEYLLDRIMGRPTQPHEFAKMTDEELIKRATETFGRDGAAGTDAAVDTEGE